MEKNIHNSFEKTKFMELPIGSIKPRGWLLNQLKLQAKGLTGRLEEIWEDLGKDSGWLGGTGESWERGPYYCDGLVPLAYILNDRELIVKAKKWIEWTLRSQKESGFFGPEKNEDWWPRMVMLKALKSYYEVTGDERISSFMLKYFTYQNEQIDSHCFTIWEHSRLSDTILLLNWLFEMTGEEFLINLAKKLMKKTRDWNEYFGEFPFNKSTAYYMDWDNLFSLVKDKGLEILKNSNDSKVRHLYEVFEGTHVVNVAMGIKYPALSYLVTGERDRVKIADAGIKKLKQYHGVANGLFTGDEHLSGNNPNQGTELCAVVEYMYSLEKILLTFGCIRYADILEKVAYNALPATLDQDIMSHQYDQQVNQIKCSVEPRDWYNNKDDSNIFGLVPNFGCCTANMHQGWPKFVKHMWAETRDNGIVALIYGPSEVIFKKNNREIRIIEDTNYPFDDKIVFRIMTDEAVSFPLYLRIPEWVNTANYSFGEESKTVKGNCYLKLERVWKNNYVVELLLEPDVRISKWYKNSISIERGSLVFALKIKERWQNMNDSEEYPEYEVFPESSWNYALEINFKDKAESFKVLRSDEKLPEQPFNSGKATLTIIAKGRKLSEWSIENNSAGNLPQSPVISNAPLEEVTLIPYGAARLRIAQFPYLKKG